MVRIYFTDIDLGSTMTKAVGDMEHALRNALIPVLAMAGMGLAMMITILGANLTVDWLRDKLDLKLRQI